VNYHKYITSRDWRQNPARLAELEASGFRCRLCNDDGLHSALEAHHRTYQNLGDEQPGDLTTLCRGCHRLVTDHQRRLRYTCSLPKFSDVRVVLENPAPLFDPTFKEML
jgi:5-methylcytosine-specific restriction endonuclease McrA